MSTPRWTDAQLLAAFTAAADLVGWTGEPSTITRDEVALLIARRDSADEAAHDASRLLPGASTADAVHFARRVREHLGVDKPAWMRLQTERTDNPWTGRLIAGDFRLCSQTTDGHGLRWEGTLRRGEEHLTVVNYAPTEAAVFAQLHDALVRYHLAGLRAATGDAT